MLHRMRPLSALAVVAILVAALAVPASAPAAGVRTLATGLQVPWGLAFLPGGDALVSERATGRILRVPRAGGRARPVMRVPGVAAEQEAGLLGLAVSPRYAKDRLVYAYLTTATDNRIVRFRLGGTPRPVYTGIRKARYHDGGRIAFGPDGKLYAAVGDATRGSDAQALDRPNGKILRMNPSGGVPDGNPFPGSRVWSFGHRNVQGLAWDRAGRLWATEFGQKTFDEVNLIVRGANYGWPKAEGPASSPGMGFTDPKLTWTPTSTSSPSGAAILGSTLYVAALAGRGLWRIPLAGESAGAPRKLLAGRFGRLRTVARAPDGSLWITTSNRDGRGVPGRGDDRILRYRP